MCTHLSICMTLLDSGRNEQREEAEVSETKESKGVVSGRPCRHSALGWLCPRLCRGTQGIHVFLGVVLLPYAE